MGPNGVRTEDSLFFKLGDTTTGIRPWRARRPATCPVINIPARLFLEVIALGFGRSHWALSSVLVENAYLPKSIDGRLELFLAGRQDLSMMVKHLDSFKCWKVKVDGKAASTAVAAPEERASLPLSID
jgi:hypothetical protein